MRPGGSHPPHAGRKGLFGHPSQLRHQPGDHGGAYRRGDDGGQRWSWPHLIDRIPAGLLAALIAAFTAQFVGALLQARVTTSADLGVVDVLTVERRQWAAVCGIGWVSNTARRLRRHDPFVSRRR